MSVFVSPDRMPSGDCLTVTVPEAKSRTEGMEMGQDLACAYWGYPRDINLADFGIVITAIQSQPQFGGGGSHIGYQMFITYTKGI